MNLRPYQQRSIDALYQWWVAHPGIEESPICVMPTGSGKSVVIAELCRLLFDTWPEEHPRTIVLVPSKELAEQNAAKLVAMLPSHLSVGYYSASLGRKAPSADVIVATIGSIYRDAHLLGNIRCVVIDECHLVNPGGAEAGRYRQFLADLARLCNFRVVGYTATPFRGDGIWLTDGDAPLFTGIASTITTQELLDAGFLAPLVRPADAVATQIDVQGIKATGGDFNLDELSERVAEYLPAAAAEAVQLAAGRRKWIAFTATVRNAEHLVRLLQADGIATALVCGETDKTEREQLIEDFRAGRLRCLVTVLALATGFDVPDVDCILWLRPTKSPVLYVQGAGRGLRIAEGKTDCLWLDFSDTTERMGPVDTIKGRKRSNRKDTDGQAPTKVCNECGERASIAASVCPSCGAEFPPPEAPEARSASNAAIMAHQVQSRINTYPVTDVSYSLHTKPGSANSVRVDYHSGLRRVASEWVCVEHTGFARAKAEGWMTRRGIRPASDCADLLAQSADLVQPAAVVVNETGKYPEIVRFEWESHEPDRTESHARRAEEATA